MDNVFLKRSHVYMILKDNAAVIDDSIDFKIAEIL